MKVLSIYLRNYLIIAQRAPRRYELLHTKGVIYFTPFGGERSALVITCDPIPRLVRTQARKAALEATLPKGETKPLQGEITTDEKFGYLATLVAYQVIRERAAMIAEAIDKKGLAEDPVKTLIVDDRNLAQSDLPLVQVERQFEFFCAQFAAQVRLMDDLLQETAAAYPPAPFAAEPEVQRPAVEATQMEALPLTAIAPMLMAAPALISSVADIAGYFKTDYTVKGQAVDISNDALMAEVAGRIRRHAVHLLNFSLVKDSELVRRWGELVEQKLILDSREALVKAQIVEPATARIASLTQQSAALQAEVNKLAMLKDEPRRTEVQGQLDKYKLELQYNQELLSRAQRAVANAAALAQAIGEFVTSLTATSDPASPPLWMQGALRQQIRQEGITHLLYLKVVSSGGDAITKKRLWGSGETSYLGGTVVAYVLASVRGKIELAGSETGLAQLDHRYSQTGATHLNPVSLDPTSPSQ